MTIVVLGDLGRSPRMSAHAAALARHGVQVTLAGYVESPLDAELAELTNIRVQPIRQRDRAGDRASRLSFLFTSVLRAVRQHLDLGRALMNAPKPDAILVQNPPAIPTLMVCWAAARVRRVRLVIDWHNFGWAMMGLRLGIHHPAVRLARAYEQFWGRRADGHLCVSAAMRESLSPVLRSRRAPVLLYDRPRCWFPPLTPEQKAESLRQTLEQLGVAWDGRAVAVCPTSWTADEDTDLLLDGLAIFDRSDASPRLLVLMTGKGPRRAAFEERIRQSKWRRVDVRTLFLPIEQYRSLLRGAHFGLSLHRSSSGFDLPMKIVDMLGARTPVCALDYGAVLNEQLSGGQFALTFRNAEELSARLDELMADDALRLRQLQCGAAGLCDADWYKAWDAAAPPLFPGICDDEVCESHLSTTTWD